MGSCASRMTSGERRLAFLERCTPEGSRLGRYSGDFSVPRRNERMRPCIELRPAAAPSAQRRGQLSPQRGHDQGADHARQQGAGVSGGGAGGHRADANGWRG